MPTRPSNRTTLAPLHAALPYGKDDRNEAPTRGIGVHIHHQRAERVHLQQFVAHSSFGETLASGEEATILGLWRSTQHHPSNSKIEVDQGVRLITSGWAAWLRHADNGRRLIFLFLMPGDFIVPPLFIMRNCELVCLTPVRTVDASTLTRDGGALSPNSSAMIEQSSRRDHHLLLDHLTRLILGSTTGSVALLLTEFHERSLRSGACVDGKFNLPIGQRVLAASLGRSAVQVNKVMSKFQLEGLIRVGYDWLEVVEPEALRALAGVSNQKAAPPFPQEFLQAAYPSPFETSDTSISMWGDVIHSDFDNRSKSINAANTGGTGSISVG